jgi:hypothetical protein
MGNEISVLCNCNDNNKKESNLEHIMKVSIMLFSHHNLMRTINH